MDIRGVGFLTKRRVHRPCGGVVLGTLKGEGEQAGRPGRSLVSWGRVAADDAEGGWSHHVGPCRICVKGDGKSEEG